ncbi:unnamed protein product [Protopolystoma xenopodis]|uniref:Uncharacterized protein n=1 Tax=Protopolystoma xenopodis TaxID=117903 RepID=A0A448X6X4_9PLAT|nr:unnamed protein product [Protopolystoma xenopodis]
MAKVSTCTPLTVRRALSYHLKKKAEGISLSYASCWYVSCPHPYLTVNRVILQFTPPIQDFLTGKKLPTAHVQHLMETRDPPKETKQIASPTGVKADVKPVNRTSAMPADSDSDCEHRSLFPLKCEKMPQESLRYILTIWYSPEVSSMLAGKSLLSEDFLDSMSAAFNDTEIEHLLSCPLKEILHEARRYFAEMGI